MPNNKGFAVIELLMQGLAATGFLAMAALIGVHSTLATSQVAASRAQAQMDALRSDLEDLAVRQVLHYADHLTYSGSANELRFTPSEGVRVSIVATRSGWSGVAHHTAVGRRHGCAVFVGNAVAPKGPVTPPRPDQVVCTR